MNDIYYFIISYVIILGIAFFLINFLSNGFFTKFIKVKASRGRLSLIEVHSITDVYYCAGKFTGEYLIYTNRDKETKRILASKENIFRKIGVFSACVDDIKNCILDVNFKNVSGFDAVKIDHYINRIMHAPNIDEKTQKFILAGIILACIGICGLAYLIIMMDAKIVNLQTAITGLKALSGNI